jgi:hypothetical protein
MREAQKATLAEAIWCLGDCAANPESDENMVYILDGGSLLHKIPWPRGYTFKGICQLYVDYVRKRYGFPSTVFDGYMDGPSTKDFTHQRRSKGIMGTTILFTEDTPFRSKKDHFLANSVNKQNFINLLGASLQTIGCEVVHAAADADVTIVKTAVEWATRKKATLIGEDTDLLVLLCYHAVLEDNDIVFRSDRHVGLTRKVKVWSVRKTKTVLGKRICNLHPAVHALTGCDTTSRMFGIGKGAALKKVRSCEVLQNDISHFQECIHQEQVTCVGERIIVALYGGSSVDNLNSLRLRLFTEKAINNRKTVEIHTLPPTSASAKFHCLRARLQIGDWIGESKQYPCCWGWKLDNGLFVPVRTDMPPAPSELMAIIRCKCKTNCDSKRCSCRKHGLECSIACKECKGSSCSNSLQNELDVSDTDV